MLPMPRRRFNLLAPRTLLIGAAVGLLIVVGSWALSFLGSHGLRLSERCSIYSHRGTVQLHVETATQLRYSAGGTPKVVEVTPQQWFGNRTMPQVSIHLSAWRPYSSGYVMSMQSTALPGGKVLNYGYRLDAAGIAHWVLAAPLAAVLIVLLRVERRRRRAIAAGGCRHCGYDLRATPERCPECGMEPRATPSAAALPPSAADGR